MPEAVRLLQHIGQHIARLARHQRRCVDADRRRRLDDLFRDARALPGQAQTAGRGMLDVVDPDLIGLARDQRHAGLARGRARGDRRQRGPGRIADWTDQQIGTVACSEDELIGLGRRRDDLALPAGREAGPAGRGEAGRWRTARTDRGPIEIEPHVAALERRVRHPGRAGGVAAQEAAVDDALRRGRFAPQCRYGKAEPKHRRRGRTGRTTHPSQFQFSIAPVVYD